MGNIFGRDQPPEVDVSEDYLSQTQDELDAEPGCYYKCILEYLYIMYHWEIMSRSQ